MVERETKLTLKQLNLNNCKIYNAYSIPITLASPIENLNIQNCYFSGSQIDGYFLQANTGANITNFTFIGNTLIGDGLKMRGAFINITSSLTNFFDSGNTMNAVHERLKSHLPASLTAVTLLKRYRCKRPTYPFIYGTEVKKEWVYGYGMDNESGYCRNLDAIYKI